MTTRERRSKRLREAYRLRKFKGASTVITMAHIEGARDWFGFNDYPVRLILDGLGIDDNTPEIVGGGRYTFTLPGDNVT